MYALFLVVSVALVTLSPLGLELWLSLCETRAQRRLLDRVAREKGPGIAWVPLRLR